MRGDLVYEKLGEIDPDLVADALPDAVPLVSVNSLTTPPKPPRGTVWRRVAVIAACILLTGLLLVGGGVWLFQDEAKQPWETDATTSSDMPDTDPADTVQAPHGTGMEDPSQTDPNAPNISPENTTQTPQDSETDGEPSSQSPESTDTAQTPHDSEEDPPETVPEPAPDPKEPFSFGYELTASSTVYGGESIEIILSLTNNGEGFGYFGYESDYAPKAKLITVVAGETVTLLPEYETASDVAAEHWIDTGKTGRSRIRISIPMDEYLNGADFDLILTYGEHIRVFRDVLTVEAIQAETFGGEMSVISDREKLLNVSLTDNEEQKEIAQELISVFNANVPVRDDEYRDVNADVRFRVGGSVLWYNTDSGYLTNRATRTQYHLTQSQMTTVNSYVERLEAAYGTVEDDGQNRFKGTLHTITERYTSHSINATDDLETRMYARLIKSLLNNATQRGRKPTSAQGDTYSFRFDDAMVWYRSDIDAPHIEDRFDPAEWRLDTDTHTELQCIMETLFKEQLKVSCSFTYKTATVLRNNAYEATVHYNGFHYELIGFVLKHRETGYEIPFYEEGFMGHTFIIPEDAPEGKYDLVASLWGELGNGVFYSETAAVTVVKESTKADYDFSYEIKKQKPAYQVGDRLLVDAYMTNKGDTITRYGSNAAVCANGKLVTVKDGQEIVLDLDAWMISEDGAQVRTLGKGRQSYMELKLDIPEDAVGGTYDLILYFEGHEKVFENAVTISDP